MFEDETSAVQESQKFCMERIQATRQARYQRYCLLLVSPVNLKKSYGEVGMWQAKLFAKQWMSERASAGPTPALTAKSYEWQANKVGRARL